MSEAEVTGAGDIASPAPGPAEDVVTAAAEPVASVEPVEPVVAQSTYAPADWRSPDPLLSGYDDGAVVVHTAPDGGVTLLDPDREPSAPTVDVPPTLVEDYSSGKAWDIPQPAFFNADAPATAASTGTADRPLATPAPEATE